MSRSRRPGAKVLRVLVVGGLVLVGLALLFGRPKLALFIAAVDPVLPP